MWWFATLLLQAASYQEGMQALEQKDYRKAAASFERAVTETPSDYAAHFHHALALSLLGNDAEAIPEYRKTLELKPRLYEAELNLGILLLRQKQAAEAIPLLAEAAAQRPKQPRPQLYLGDAYFASGDFARAEKTYTDALAADNHSKDAELGLARALLKQNKVDEAAPHFRNTGSLLELAGAYETAGRNEEALAIYKQFPADMGAQEHAGQLLLAQKKPAEALPFFEAAVAKSPTPANRYALAMLKGRVLRDERKFAPAAQEFLRAAQIQPDSAESWSELAGAAIMAENYGAALAALDRVKALNAETAAHHYFRAIVLDKLRQAKPALESYQRFLAADAGKSPDEEFKARQRVRILEKELSRH